MSARAGVVSWFGSAVLLVMSSCASPRGNAQSVLVSPSSIFVVRHAEKADPSNPDTPLSPAGEARAIALAEVLANKGVKAVFATEFIRTQQTAQPAARAAGVDVVIMKNADRPLLLERAKALAPGSSVLIVGHSNTVPAIVQELSGEPVDGINENEYDNLYEIVVEADGRKRLVRSRFGEPYR